MRNDQNTHRKAVTIFAVALIVLLVGRVRHDVSRRRYNKR